MNNTKVYIAVDPGADGAVIALQGNVLLDKATVPKIKIKSTKPSKTREGKIKKDAKGKNIYADKLVMDEQAYFDIIRSFKIKYPDALVTVEKVRNIQGTSAMTNFNFGHNYGLLRGFLIAVFGIKSIQEVAPQTWQKKVQTIQDLVLDPNTSSKDTKATALNAFKRLFPNVHLYATTRSSTHHDGLVDALLIAKYAQLTDTVIEEVFVDEF